MKIVGVMEENVRAAPPLVWPGEVPEKINNIALYIIENNQAVCAKRE